MAVRRSKMLVSGLKRAYVELNCCRTGTHSFSLRLRSATIEFNPHVPAVKKTQLGVRKHSEDGRERENKELKLMLSRLVVS